MSEKKQKNYRLYESEARVFRKEEFSEDKQGDNDFSAISICDNFVLVYSENDIKYMESIFEQVEFEHYAPNRSIEDEIFDAYEDEVYDIDRIPYKTKGMKIEQDEVHVSFRHKNEKCGMPMNVWINIIDAKTCGSKVEFTPFNSQKGINKFKILYVYTDDQAETKNKKESN